MYKTVGEFYDKLYEVLDDYIIVAGNNGIYDYGVCGVIESLLNDSNYDHTVRYVNLNETDGIFIISFVNRSHVYCEIFFYRKDLSTFG